MKRIITSILFAVLAIVSMTAQNKVMPVYTDELIDEAPSGQVVSGVQRSCYSYYYSGGALLGGYNDGFTGEYIIGDDGCIYIKEPCASVKIGSYLKLDKIDDENYVAHTAQLVWVYDNGGTPYTYFATRLVFQKYGDTQYGYAMETDADGKEITDIYFTFKNGVLQQKDQTVVDFNGQILPHEMIGLTNSTGGWIGYGDACITMSSPEYAATTLPEGAVVKEGSFTYCTMSSTTGENVKTAQLTKYAESGDNFYMLNPVDGTNWIKGQIDRSANTVTFLPQYVGVNESIGCHQWFKPATYNDWRDVWDEEENVGTWVRDFTAADSYVCKYENGSAISDPEQKQTLVISLSKDAIQTSGAYSVFSIRPYEPKLAKPATPKVLKLSPVEDTGFFGEIIFAVSPIDENDVYINTEELYYNIYLNSMDTPFCFTQDEYEKIPSEKMTDIPYLYDDNYEFDCNGAFHNIYFYTPGVKYVGIQAIHRVGNEELRSDIAWYGDVPTGIQTSLATATGTTVKKIENGSIVIVKNGVKYNINGQTLK